MKILKYLFLIFYAAAFLFLFIGETPIVSFFIILFVLFFFSCFLMYMTRRNKEHHGSPVQVGNLMICVILIVTLIIFSSGNKISSLETTGIYIYIVSGAVYIFGVTNVLRKKLNHAS